MKQGEILKQVQHWTWKKRKRIPRESECGSGLKSGATQQSNIGGGESEDDFGRSDVGGDESEEAVVEGEGEQ